MNAMNEMPAPLVFTDAAAAKVKNLIDEEGNPDLKLRVFVSGGGCSGFQYGFTFDEVTLTNPYVRMVRAKDGSANLNQLVPRSEPEPNAPPSELVGVLIHTLALRGGRVEFEDHGAEQPFSTTLGPIDVMLRESGSSRSSGLFHSDISRSGSGNGSGFSSVALTMLNIVVLAPMPRASVRMATTVKPGLRVKRRMA